ncbi:MAG: SDR family NAD(P)-dependent oxidoreductase [Cyanobacteria bacterium P01_C01_bin.89]
MSKTILLTGATDGIGLETAKLLVAQGHRVLLHGRTPTKLAKVAEDLAEQGAVESYTADLADLAEVKTLAESVAAEHGHLDVLINNAGVLKTSTPITQDGLDVRFVVNAIAPYLLTKKLLPLMNPSGRVVNVSSAAQSPVDLHALTGQHRVAEDFSAYAQSKLAITMWSRYLARSLGNNGPIIVAVNPGSLLGSKMVREGFGMAGKDLQIGANILCRAALSEDFATASGKYFDNDAGQFASPHADALDDKKSGDVVRTIKNILQQQLSG